MDPDIKEVVTLMADKVKNLKRSRPDEVSSSPISTESSAKKKKKKKAETAKDGTDDDGGNILPNHESSWTTISEPKISCRKCTYVAKTNSHLKSHYFNHHLSD